MKLECLQRKKLHRHKINIALMILHTPRNHSLSFLNFTKQKCQSKSRIQLGENFLWWLYICIQCWHKLQKQKNLLVSLLHKQFWTDWTNRSPQIKTNLKTYLAEELSEIFAIPILSKSSPPLQYSKNRYCILPSLLWP